jgi:hypothetical protein
MSQHALAGREQAPGVGLARRLVRTPPIVVLGGRTAIISFVGSTPRKYWQISNLAQVALDVLLAEQRDVEPEMLAEARLRALALGDVFLHAPAHDVARRQLLLSGS